MKKSLSHQFVIILLVPIIIIVTTSYYIISYIYEKQTENMKNYCTTTTNNVEINLSSMTTAMKKTASLFSSADEIQEYLRDSSADKQPLQRQSFFNLIELSKAYAPDLVDIIVWDEHSPTSMISYLPADMENFAVRNFQDETKNTSAYFEFYATPRTLEPYLIYFTPVSMTKFSESFGKHLGNIAVLCRTDTLNKLINSTTDMYLDITDNKSGQILYVNHYPKPFGEQAQQEFFRQEETIVNTNLSVTGVIYSGQVNLLPDTQSAVLLILGLLSVFYVVYIAFAVHHVIIRPIHELNASIETIDYEHDEMHLQTSLQNEIGSIASQVNTLLTRVSSLNHRNIAAQARLYELELSKKQTQLYAYQSQINPHFLYNMLQCMRGISLMHGIPEVAQICTNMAMLFRYSIKGTFLVPLKEEINIIDKYLYMIRIRFQDRIIYELETASDTLDCLIPKMILQPIVENAIFHGLENTESGGTVYIRTFREEKNLFITIHDNGSGFEQETLTHLQQLLSNDIAPESHNTFEKSDGLGIMNIHNKIQLYEGDDYGISVTSSPGETVVTLHLNAEQAENV